MIYIRDIIKLYVPKFKLEATQDVLPIVEQNNSFNFEIYPNPAQNQFTLQIDLQNLYQANIFISNTHGQIIDKISLNSDDKYLHYNTSHLARGCFHATLVNNNQSITKKIIIQ